MADIYGFKKEEVATTLVKVARKESVNPVRSLQDDAPKAGKAIPREYWIVPNGTIPAATSSIVPGIGKGFIAFLDRDEDPPTLKRYQYDGADREVDVYNYRTEAVVNAGDLDPIVRASEDVFGELAILPKECCGGDPGSTPNYEVGWQFVSTETPVPPGAAIHRISHDYSTNICNESATETICTITFENIHPTDPLVLSATNYLQFSLIFGAIEDRTACNFNSISDGGTEELFQGGTPTKYRRRAKWTSGSVPAGGSITRTVAVNCTIEPRTLGSPAGTFESRVDYIVGGLGADPYSTRYITNTATCGS